MTEDLGFEDLSPRSWLDAFPWLRGASSGELVSPWWDEHIDDTPPDERWQRLGQISHLAMGRLTDWTIGQIFPGLSPDLDLLDLDLPTRVLNVLAREGCSAAGPLSVLTLDQLMGWHRVGIQTVDVILRSLADASTSLATASVFTHDAPTVDSLVLHKPPPRSPEWLATTTDDLSTIALWQTAIGLPGNSLFQGDLPVGTPGDVLKARQRLEELTAADVLNDRERSMDAAGLLDDALASLDQRAVRILELRLFADRRLSLDEVGREFGVTRERVRQVEGRARTAMLDAISAGQLDLVASAARSLIGTVRPLSDLLQLMPALGREVALVAQPVWRVLDRLDDAYEIEDGWCVVPTLSAAQDWTSTQLRERANQYGVVLLDELDLIETSAPDDLGALTTQWLERCGYVIHGGHVLTRTQSVGDYAAAILSICGEPVGVQEIINRFRFERTTGSLRNAMSVDDRFERVDRDRWALREWGMDAYASIRSVIRMELAKAGGTIPIDTLVERIAGTYSVTSSSVIAYASTPPFELRGGVVRPAGTSRAARKPPERTARLYRRGQSWIYRVCVSHDHLRGSGFVAPVAVTTILGMEFGDKIQLSSELGDQLIRWNGTQPAFGTIRRYLLEYDVAAETEVFLVMSDDRRFDVDVVEDLTGDPLSDALALVGARRDLSCEAARQALEAAVGLPEDSPVVSMIGTYRDRGDGDVADLLTAVRYHLETGEPPGEPPKRTIRSTDVDDIMDLLS